MKTCKMKTVLDLAFALFLMGTAGADVFPKALQMGTYNETGYKRAEPWTPTEDTREISAEEKAVFSMKHPDDRSD